MADTSYLIDRIKDDIQDDIQDRIDDFVIDLEEKYEENNIIAEQLRQYVSYLHKELYIYTVKKQMTVEDIYNDLNQILNVD